MEIPEADDTSTKSSNRLPFTGQAPTFERVYAFRWVHLLSPSAVGAFAFDIGIVALGPVSMTLGFRFPPHERSVVFRKHLEHLLVRCIQRLHAVTCRPEEVSDRFRSQKLQVARHWYTERP